MLMRRYQLSAIGILLCGVLFAGVAEAGRDQIIAAGKNEYNESCKACHGATGKGDGEMASLLVKPPANLTLIRSRNNGLFPFWRIFQMVSGVEKVEGHQTIQMPKYWYRFREQENLPGYDLANQRILAVTHYLESIQASD